MDLQNGKSECRVKGDEIQRCGKNYMISMENKDTKHNNRESGYCDIVLVTESVNNTEKNDCDNTNAKEFMIDDDVNYKQSENQKRLFTSGKKKCYSPSSNLSLVQKLLKLPKDGLLTDEKLELFKLGRECPVLQSREYIIKLEYNKFKWITGCKNTNRVYCWPCLFFNTDNISLNSKGLDIKSKDVTVNEMLLRNHSKFNGHKKAARMCAEQESLHHCGPLNKKMSEQRDGQKNTSLKCTESANNTIQSKEHSYMLEWSSTSPDKNVFKLTSQSTQGTISKEVTVKPTTITESIAQNFDVRSSNSDNLELASHSSHMTTIKSTFNIAENVDSLETDFSSNSINSIVLVLASKSTHNESLVKSIGVDQNYEIDYPSYSIDSADSEIAPESTHMAKSYENLVKSTVNRSQNVDQNCETEKASHSLNSANLDLTTKLTCTEEHEIICINDSDTETDQTYCSDNNNSKLSKNSVSEPIATDSDVTASVDLQDDSLRTKSLTTIEHTIDTVPIIQSQFIGDIGSQEIQAEILMKSDTTNEDETNQQLDPFETVYIPEETHEVDTSWNESLIVPQRNLLIENSTVDKSTSNSMTSFILEQSPCINEEVIVRHAKPIQNSTPEELNRIQRALKLPKFSGDEICEERYNLVKLGRTTPDFIGTLKPNILDILYSKHDWLAGCAKEKQIFCWPCILFYKACRLSERSDGFMIDEKLISTRIDWHENCFGHIEAVSLYNILSKSQPDDKLILNDENEPVYIRGDYIYEDTNRYNIQNLLNLGLINGNIITKERLEIFKLEQIKPPLTAYIKNKHTQSYYECKSSKYYNLHSWLSGCPILNKLFCWTCLFFGSHETMLTMGCNFLTIDTEIECHLVSTSHVRATKFYSVVQCLQSNPSTRDLQLTIVNDNIEVGSITFGKVVSMVGNASHSKSVAYTRHWLHFKTSIDSNPHARDSIYQLLKLPQIAVGSPCPEKVLHIIQKGRPTPQLPKVIKVQDRGMIMHTPFTSKIYEEYDWLAGCSIKNRIYCWPCLLFSVRHGVWSKEGLDKLTYFSERAKLHSETSFHQTANQSYQTLITLLKSNMKSNFIIKEKRDDNHELYIELFNEEHESASTISPKQIKTRICLPKYEIIPILLNTPFHTLNNVVPRERLEILKLGKPSFEVYLNEDSSSNETQKVKVITHDSDLLTGCSKSQRVFCWCCLLFSDEPSGVWNSKGVDCYVTLRRTFHEHLQSSNHQVVFKLYQLMNNVNKGVNVQGLEVTLEKIVIKDELLKQLRSEVNQTKEVDSSIDVNLKRKSQDNNDSNIKRSKKYDIKYVTLLRSINKPVPISLTGSSDILKTRQVPLEEGEIRNEDYEIFDSKIKNFARVWEMDLLSSKNDVKSKCLVLGIS